MGIRLGLIKSDLASFCFLNSGNRTVRAAAYEKVIKTMSGRPTIFDRDKFHALPVSQQRDMVRDMMGRGCFNDFVLGEVDFAEVYAHPKARLKDKLEPSYSILSVKPSDIPFLLTVLSDNSVSAETDKRLTDTKTIGKKRVKETIYSAVWSCSGADYWYSHTTREKRTYETDRRQFTYEVTRYKTFPLRAKAVELLKRGLIENKGKITQALEALVQKEIEGIALKVELDKRPEIEVEPPNEEVVTYRGKGARYGTNVVDLDQE